MTLKDTSVTPLNEHQFTERASALLRFVYGEARAVGVLRRLMQLIERYADAFDTTPRPLWSERSQVLITYGNTVSAADPDVFPLNELNRFLGERLNDTFSAVHILPFFSWSSDDGFSITHYLEVSPDLGDWADVRRIAEGHNLMLDLVINHVSRESLWFADYIAGTQPGRDYFIELPANTDVSRVTRPRNTPLLVPVSTRRGTRHVWATFSDDQIDLNFENPDVLIEMLGVLLNYLSQGARIVRLDAIAFLWKELGTACIHLPQTHAIVKLIRAVFDYLVPGVLLITETNVPHHENLSYFGDGDEAHLVYQFTLPPLLVHTLSTGDAAPLTEWAATLPPLPAGCTYFNFTASHDGIGVRALEGLLPEHDISQLLELMKRFGGHVSMKTGPDGEDSPYEINITYFDAMKGTRKGEDPWQIGRFLCSQTIMMGLQGIPGVYLHSLTATGNDTNGVQRTGHLRAINRKRWQRDTLEHLLDSPTTPTRIVFERLTERLKLRRAEPCFHPDVPQKILELSPQVFAFLRGPLENGRRLLALHNVSDQPQAITLPDGLKGRGWTDLIDNLASPDDEKLLLKPYRSAWLVSQS
ncbi:sugar phosphorylase [Larsenimonas suaedae]|uniref:Sugar phosphorylase n=1 Tax=Larsenimonas suaedae TaxID=1851019 RepID=A0ABU1GWH7_9GAMM|nr:sugar phosphorylase [Larsenimonas suaedae]MCM2972967.1 sugar phosphorylase [Larsenimonas suaedae]MDR5896404.1 sugar phosphorylase [Larsenimonas suaedae]